MFDLGEIIGLMCLSCVLFAAGVLLGGWLVFKSKNAVRGEGLFGGVPKGEVFHLPDDTNAELENDAEKNILDRSKEFLKTFGGGQ